MQRVRGRFILIVVYVQFPLCALIGDQCSALRAAWPHRYPGIPVRAPAGDDMPVIVLGEGGAPRAAAALLLVTVREVLGYWAYLQLDSANLCELSRVGDWQRAVIAPVARWPSSGCNAEKRHVDALTDYTAAASAFSIHLLAHVARRECRDLIINSCFYSNATNILNNCGFIKSKNITTQNCEGKHREEICIGALEQRGGIKLQAFFSNIRESKIYFAVLARNESKHDIQVAKELQRRITEQKLPMHIVFLKNDFLLRQNILLLQRQNKTFLFLDEDIWTNNLKVFRLPPPPCGVSYERCSYELDPGNAFRIGNGEFLKRFAIPISNFIQNFAPQTADLREILAKEIALNVSNIEEAACSWALQHKSEIENWTNSENINNQQPLQFAIKIYLCEDDPDLDEHKSVINITEYFLSMNIKKIQYRIILETINCLDNKRIFWEIITNIREQKIAGLIAWGRTVTNTAATVAENVELPLVLAGPALPDVPLDNAVHATTAPLMNLTSAYLELLERCHWTRVAILSDSSTYSKAFINLLLNKTKLLTREIIVDLKNIKVALDKFRADDARIFLLNTNSIISGVILCTAMNLGMTPDAGFVWLLRDWRTTKCNTGDDWGTMYHFTLGLSWRGGPTVGGSIELQSQLRKLWRTRENVLTGTADSASLADALLFLGYGFANFLNEHPSHISHPHGFGNIKNYSKSLKKITVNGTAQELKSIGGEKLIFLEKWHGNTGSSVALWCVSVNGIRDIWPTNLTTCKQIFGKQIPDRHHCLTFTTGDPFAPRCHLLTISIVIVILILAAIVLHVVRRTQLSISRREKEESQRVVSWLDIYLVQRNLITLFHVIGSGSNGLVRFAELRKPGETVLVAAKEPHECTALLEENEFLHEACLLAPLSHENVIRLVGVCIGGGPPIVLMEHAYYNDLHRYLTFRRQFAICARVGEVTVEEAMEVSDGELTRFAREAARALEYLTDKRIVHRDVRAANCLVDKNRSLKLADFGMARALDSEETLYMTTRRGLFPVSWMPPESLIKGVFSPASDIWALGVLILEVTTLGARPYGDWPLEQVFHYVKSGGHPPLPPDISKQTRNLVLACWQQDVKARLSAASVHDFLTQNTHAISPALLTPDMPELSLHFTKRN